MGVKIFVTLEPQL